MKNKKIRNLKKQRSLKRFIKFAYSELMKNDLSKENSEYLLNKLYQIKLA